MIRTACDSDHKRGSAGDHDIQAYFKVFNGLLVTAVVIASAVALFASTIKHTLKMVVTTASVTEIMNSYRTPLSTTMQCRAIGRKVWKTGAMFPYETDRSLASFGKNIGSSAGDRYIVTAPVTGNTLTLHPAVPIEEPLGPVKWVAGNGNPDGWSIVGEDHTTLETGYIQKLLQR
jgi:hypothetical protein